MSCEFPEGCSCGATKWNQAVDRIQELENLILQSTSMLSECYKLTGADPDGNEDWRLAPRAVEEVRRMRQEFDESESRVFRLEDEVVDLEGEIQDLKLNQAVE